VSFPFRRPLTRDGRAGFERGGTGSGGVRVVLGAGAISGAGVLRMPREMLTEVAVACGCGLAYFAGRLGWGLWRTRVMTKQAECVTVTGEAMWRWERYAKIFGCESARIAVSPMIAGPVAVGGDRVSCWCQ
jgi:hypothetical protein